MLTAVIGPLGSLPRGLIVFLLSALPVVELRGGIPLGIGVFHLNPWTVFLIAVLGNTAPVIPLLLLLDPVSGWLSRKSAVMDRFFAWLFERTRQQHSERVTRYGAVGLAVFVAIPSPGTGAWTGCLVAFLFAMPFRYAFPAIVAGVIGAGLLVTGVATGLFAFLGFLNNPLLSAALVAVFVALIVWAFRRNK